MPIPILVLALFAIKLPTDVPAKALTPAQHDARLAQILKDWKAAEDRVKDVRKVIRRTYDDRVWRTKETHQITVLGKKPNYVRCEIKDERGKQLHLSVVNGNKFRHFDILRQTESVADMPANFPECHTHVGGFVESMARSFQLELQWPILGFDVELLNKNYDLKLIKEDENYFYLSVKDRKQENSLPSWVIAIVGDGTNNGDETKIALNKATFQPRKILKTEACGNTSDWDFLKTEINVNPPVALETIEANLPRNWKITDFRKIQTAPASSSKLQ
jgi:outer membrane lipoprotein-sorting protein